MLERQIRKHVSKLNRYVRAVRLTSPSKQAVTPCRRNHVAAFGCLQVMTAGAVTRWNADGNFDSFLKEPSARIQRR